MGNLRSLYAAAVLLLGFSAAARATAILDASSSATLSIAGIVNLTSPGNLSGLSVSGDSEVLSDGVLFVGNAFASTGSGAEVTGAPPFLGLDHLAAAEGTADAVGTAEAFVLTDGFLGFENASTDSFLITLLLDYALSAAAAVDDASREDAFSSAFVNLVSNSSTIDFFSMVTADAALGPPSDGDSGQLFFELLVGPGGFDTVFLSTFGDGFAGAVQVPEASMLSSTALLFAAFLAIERSRRRNR
jgi:hypothetical protein